MIRTTTWDGFRGAAKRGGIVPVVREYAADTLTPVAAFAALHRGPWGFLLESLVGGERWARYSFLGTEPREAWRFTHGAAHRWTPSTGWDNPRNAADPLTILAERLAFPVAEIPGLPRFVGGAVGFLGYETVHAFERLPTPRPDTLGLPDAVFLITDTVVVMDNAFGRVLVVATPEVPAGANEATLRAIFENAEVRIAALMDRLAHATPLEPLALATPAEVTVPDDGPFPRAAFEAGVATLKEHIAAGDIFQAVLARRIARPTSAHPFRVYRALRTLNPAPYLFYLALDDMALAGSSPEVLVRVEDGEVTVRPIAGTRPRGATPDEDDRLAADLRADPKELAEHAMLVDLGRNDVGRVADFGTVRVTADRALERYSHVQHLVSEVRGRLRTDADAFAALRACFPAGTVSGAPKIRAMELLNALEPTRRGPYAGAVGYVGWGGRTMDTAIAIRTAILKDGQAWVQAGAGIVADSDPAREFDETSHKARAVLAALALADS
ncbi:MAG: chorismate-binding protein [Gemmatimonadales bacterium]